MYAFFFSSESASTGLWCVPGFGAGFVFALEPSELGGSQKGGFQKGGFGGCSPGTKTGTRVRSPKPPFWKPPFYLPMTLFGVDKRVVSKRVVSADVPPERKPERGYVRQNHPFTKPPFYLPVKNCRKMQKSWKRALLFSAPSPGMHQTLVYTAARNYSEINSDSIISCNWNEIFQ